MLNVQNNDNSIKIQFKDGYPTVKYVIFGLLIFILIEINWIVEEIVKQRTNPLNFSIIFI